MKKWSVLLLASLLFGIASLSSCKKENQINKNLWKGDGTWNIDVSDQKNTSTHYDEDNWTEYIANAGTIKFNEDGTGTYTFSGDSYPITYTNTDKLFTMIFVDPTNGEYDESDKFTFDIDWKKNSLDLNHYRATTYSTYDPVSQGNINVTATRTWKLKLSKK